MHILDFSSGYIQTAILKVKIFSTSLVIFSNHKLANISNAQIELSNIDLLLLREVPVKIGKSPPHPRFGLLCEIGAVSTDIYSPR